MLVSHDHRFIFIKTTKTASTSLEIALSAHLNHPDDVITPILPRDEQTRYELTGQRPRNFLDAQGQRLFWHHIPAAFARQRLGQDIWSDYFKFCFVRNPWDKVVSHFYMDLAAMYMPPDASFRDYVLKVVLPESPRRLNWPLISQHGQVAVDFVGRWERLLEDLQSVCERVGIQLTRDLPRVKANFRTDDRHYTSFYDDETRHAVGSMFADEIECFGYRFGDDWP